MKLHIKIILGVVSIIMVLSGCFLFPPAFVGAWSASNGGDELEYTFTEDTFEMITKTNSIPLNGARGSLESTSTWLTLIPTSRGTPDGNGGLTWTPMTGDAVKFSWSVNGNTLTLGHDYNGDDTITSDEILDLTRS